MPPHGNEQEYEAVFVLLIRVAAKDRVDALKLALAELAHQCEQGTVHPLLSEVHHD